MSVTCQSTPLPARPSLVLRALEWITQRYCARRQRRIDRAAFRNVLSLDAHMLKDIGVTRDDVVWAANLPIEQNAAQELRKIVRTGHTM